MKNNKITSFMIIAVILIAFLATVFIIPFERNSVFWSAFAFSIVAILLQFLFSFRANKSSTLQKSRFLGLIILFAGILYLIIQLALGILFMSLAEVLALWVANILQTLILVISIIALIMLEYSRLSVKKQEENDVFNIITIEEIRSKANALAKSSNPEIQKNLEKISELLTYSDPVSHESLEVIETSIMHYLDEIEEAIILGDNDGVFVNCDEITKLILTRNEKCKQNKHIQNRR